MDGNPANQLLKRQVMDVSVSDSAITVLLIEPNPKDAGLIEEALLAESGEFQVKRVTSLSAALDRLAAGGIDVVLLDLVLPDGRGVSVFDRVRLAAPNALILVLSGADTEDTARQAVLRGADDFMPKGRIDAYWLPRALRYVTQRKKTEAGLRAAEEALFAEKERAQVTLDSIGDSVLVTDLNSDVVYLNQVAEEMTGWASADAIGRPLSEVFNIIDGTTRHRALNPAQRAIQEDKTVGLAANCVLVRRDGSETGIEDSAAPIHNRDGRVSGAVIIFHDVSQSQTMTRRMTYLAQHDPLTGLANRTLLMDRLTQAIKLARRNQKQLALLFLDLDYFKSINDSLGHVVGDHVLQKVAGLLESSVRTTDTVCRLGGDEFVILLSEIDKPEDTAQMSGKLLKALALPMWVDGHEINVTTSIGIGIYPDDGENQEAIIQYADAAMFLVKTERAITAAASI